ncbi:metallophosphoesterase family protein [Shewanella fodinae]|uniref:metallophosphoesterase family protein n=1 Tax=Shewanella fodinae TaxID=552357 RepID=UPI00167B474B|nr:metallophosphoesterase [Shewanella fodinae]MCL2908072.1 metallophosphoesterase family protein [Shewanella fodinae]
MKALHVTDLHFNQVQMKWITANSSKADIICVTGDFINSRYDCPTPISDQVTAISDWLIGLRRPVFICSGNHDELGNELDSSWLKQIEGVYADSSIVTIQGVTIGCAAYGTTDFNRFACCMLLLHHEPPAGLSVAIQSKRDFGSKHLTAAIKDGTLSPTWILCGHVHQPEKNGLRFRGCGISNPGANLKNDVPNHHWITI